MSKFTSEIRGFTPIIDSLAGELGLMTAAVYGIVWRYCQMQDRVCHASLETISAKLGISYRSTIRHLKLLCDAGYIEDLTPGLRNRPHTYRDTGKAKITGVIEAHVTESHTADGPHVTESHTNHVTESQSESCDRESHEDTYKKQEDTDESVSLTPYMLFELWCRAQGYESDKITKTIKAKECRYAKELLKAGWLLDDIIGCLADMKADRFWSDKQISLASVAKEINEWRRKKSTKRSIAM